MLFKKKQAVTEHDSKAAALDGVNTPIMMINRDFVITYVNKETTRLLTSHQQDFKTIWPSFDANNLLGQCIDQFHKNPAHQRGILADPSKLPIITDIQVGKLSFSLTVTAQRGLGGETIGFTLEWDDVTEIRKYEETHANQSGIIDAINRSQATIEFDQSGRILKANDLFLGVMGYDESEVVGNHHSMFVEMGYRNSQEYQQFWQDLRGGTSNTAEFKRVGKGGKEIWINASYNPVTNKQGEVVKVIKIANDITQQKIAQHTMQEVLEETRSVMGAIAAGDLSPRMGKYHEESFDQLSDSVNSCASRLAQIVDDIKSCAVTLQSGITEITSGNENLSQKTTDQMASLTRTTQSMSEITGTVNTNAKNAEQAKKLASEAREFAVDGGEVVEQAVVAMEEINRSSSEIADIISVIDEIAFQTNLLALNAAVEAARAGEQGRGFAVVASEVRNLASRSAEAAKEIKSLIESSVQKVEHGSTLVNNSGKKLEQIVDGVRNVSKLVDGIADASSQQTTEIDDVNQSIDEIEKSAQHNSELVRRTSNASGSIDQQSQRLIELVSFFSTNGKISSKTADEFTDNVVAMQR